MSVLSIPFRVLVLAAAGVMVLSCSGGEEAAGKGRSSTSSLSVLVLTLADFGPEYSRMVTDQRYTNDLNNEWAASLTQNPQETLANYARHGRVTGYGRFFISPPQEIQANPGGPRYARATVGLYRTAEGARAAFEESTRAAPPPAVDAAGIRYANWQARVVTGVGEEAWLVQYAMSFESGGLSDTQYITSIRIRTGVYVAVVDIARGQGTDASAEAIELARKADQKLRAAD